MLRMIIKTMIIKNMPTTQYKSTAIVIVIFI